MKGHGIRRFLISGIVLLLASVAVLASCENPAPAENSAEALPASITVSIAEPKTIEPEGTIGITHYRISLDNAIAGTHAESGFLEKGESFTAHDVPSGMWVATADVYMKTGSTGTDSDYVHVATGKSAETAVAPGTENRISVTVDTLTDIAPGMMGLTLITPDELPLPFNYVYTITGTGQRDGYSYASSIPVSTGQNAEITIDPAAISPAPYQGTYIISITAFDGETEEASSVVRSGTEAMVLVAGTPSIGTIDISYDTEDHGPDVFGVVWDYGDPSSALTRLTPETDPAGVVTVTIEEEPVIGVSSPFDEYELYDGIRLCALALDGTCVDMIEDGESISEFVVAYNSSYDIMVYIPQMHIRVDDDPQNELRYYYLSGSEFEGSSIAPGSDMYAGAYVTSNNNESRSGRDFQVNQSIVTMRENARAKGDGWQLIDIAARNAIQYLFLIEFADWNSQGLFNQTAGTQNQTGLTDSLTYHTGYNGKVRYRYIEDLWNGTHEWTDGFNTVSGSHYVCTDPSKYQSDVTAGYTDLGSWAVGGYIGPWAVSRYITKLKYFSDMQWLIGVPEAGGGSSDTYVADYAYLYTSGTYVLSCGGQWYSYSDHGLFYFYASDGSSAWGSQHGSRLAYREM